MNHVALCSTACVLLASGAHPQPQPVMVGVVPHSGLALNVEVESLVKMGAI